MSNTEYDLIVIGAGPGGLTAAIYAQRSGLATLIIDRGAPGGQVFTTHQIDNWPGDPGISGRELSKKMYDHATSFGAVHEYGDVSRVEDKGELKEVITTTKTYTTKKVLISTGATPRIIGVKGERELSGKGVSYCAVCDGAFFKDKEIVVVGGGNSAFEEGSYLANIGTKVTLIHRRQEFRAEKILIDEFKHKDN